jgi:hypothetical protein
VTRAGWLAAAVAAVLAAPQPVSAQAATPPPAGRIELGAGGGWLAGATLGEAAATLRGRDGADFVLFESASTLAGAWAIDARVGIVLSRRYAAEARLAFSRPEIRTSVPGDVEGAPPLELAERLDRYVIDGALRVSLDGLRAGPLVPFVSVGAGYLRQLHEGLTFVEQGVAYHGGGGVTLPLFSRSTGLAKGAAVRGETRVYRFVPGGDAGSTTQVALSGGLLVMF